MNPAAETLAQAEYVRQRIAPRPGDPDYLCLVDLLVAIRQMAPGGVGKILDFGCGGSPYRSLFPGAIYHRADLAGGADLDFEFGDDSRLPSEIGGYDMIMSSQVLEHVTDPGAYFAECYRVLKPGGQLLLTTHGTFWDHACPHDYWRWTAYGLERALRNAGFEPTQVKKITTNERATLFLSEKTFGRRPSHMTKFGALYAASTHLLRRMSARTRHRMADACFPDNCVVDADNGNPDNRHLIYIIVGALATKPLER